MRLIPTTVAFACLIAATPACSSSTQAAQRSTVPALQRSNIITRDQIRARSWGNAYDLIHELHPMWLTLRGRTTLYGAPEDIPVHLDDIRVGGMANLRDMSLQNVEYIQYFPPNEASARWGTGYGNGAILISTRPLKS